MTRTLIARPFVALSSLVLLLAVACGDISTAPAESLEADKPPAVERIEVPSVIGEDVAIARNQLADRGLEVRVVKRWSPRPKGQVLNQRPGPGRNIRGGRSVVLFVARPFPRVADVVGETLSVAQFSLSFIGDYHIRVVRRELAGAEPGSVLDQEPDAGTRLRPGNVVWLLVAKASSLGCHPSYVGACLLPDASDYDCSGGSGNGPHYTGTVRVIGYDEYGLDADNDGTGCE